MDLVPGLYETLLTSEVMQLLNLIDKDQLQTEYRKLDPEDAPTVLARHVGLLVFRALRRLPETNRSEKQKALVNKILAPVIEVLNEPENSLDRIDELLSALKNREGPLNEPLATQHPFIPLSQSDLLVNAPNEKGVGVNIQREIESADSIDLICAFIRWHGFRLVEKVLREHCRRGRSLRILTTTYMGVSDRRAVDALAELGAVVKVCYETKRTRLHAKAWYFERESGFDTAYIGSSNLSRSALTDGLEWNVRLASHETPHLLDKFRGTFERYWADEIFEIYDSERDKDRFDQAVQSYSSPTNLTFSLDVHPYPHQRQILERLQLERVRYGRNKNLVVAATGTGKTVIAAFDYKRFKKQHPQARLLFVAHRKEILEQSLHVFRTVLKDGSFGELFVGGVKPKEWRHVFASVQSLARISSKVTADSFDMVIIDEFHHAAAKTYQWLLDDLKPQILLGLTATPERSDGRDVTTWFDGRISAELRLWEALEEGLLCPFHYFGVHDNTDLRGLNWTRGGYDKEQLESLLTGNSARVGIVLKELFKHVHNPREMKALGFCVSVSHAQYMAEKFCLEGIPAAALTGKSSTKNREEMLSKLRSGALKIIFAVDLFNEGLDLPEIDTVLFLRPTESVTVFLQQLGRGLRLAEDKTCLTVLDFIGRAHRRFRFDVRYRALVRDSGESLKRQVDEGFPRLPAGCVIRLDRVAQSLVLENLKQTLGTRFSGLVDELKGMGATCSLARFLDETALAPQQIYKSSGWCWSKLRRSAGFPVPAAGAEEMKLSKVLSRLLHIDDERRVQFYSRVLSEANVPTDLSPADRLQLLMLNFALWGTGKNVISLEAGLQKLWAHPAIRDELVELFQVLGNRAEFLSSPASELFPEELVDLPLSIHARYSVAEILTAAGILTKERPYPIREGVKYDRAKNRDYLFVTLSKTEKQYSPTTMYRDYPISTTLFHWESQSNTRVLSETGQRYIRHKDKGSTPLLFVRSHKKIEGKTQPYWFLGPVDYVTHRGEKPMAITWKLRVPMSEWLFMKAKSVAI
jgi:superfamily II DNA or RNA helicase